MSGLVKIVRLRVRVGVGGFGQVFSFTWVAAELYGVTMVV